jgi:hypothetical protein
MADYNMGPFRLKGRGEFLSSRPYHFMDCVTYKGSSYWCYNYDTNDGDGVIGVLPVGQEESQEYWQLLAQKGDTSESVIAYYPFITVDDGDWNYELSDKIFIPDEPTNDNLEIRNAYDGACGMIITRCTTLHLPFNSFKAIDFDYIDKLQPSQMWMYTFVYCKIDGMYKFVWNRSVVGPS